MESFDSSPNSIRVTSRFGAKTQNSQGISEYDDVVSVSSSTCGSAVNGSCAQKLNKNGTKYKTSNKKTLKNFGNVRSFRRRVKSRVIHSPLPMSDEDSLVDSSHSSPHYLKATTCSEIKKTHSQTSPRYVMDELGSALRHSDEANFRVSPFLYMPEGKLESAMSYSILWPTKNVQRGDECTRDYLFGIGEERQRSARLTAWFHTPQNYFIGEYEKYCMKLHSRGFSPDPAKPSATATNSLLHSDKSVLQVYTDIHSVEEFLTCPEFAISM